MSATPDRVPGATGSVHMDPVVGCLFDERALDRFADALAGRLAGRLAQGRFAEPEALIDVAALAARLGVTKNYVYAHLDELHAIRVGGPGGPVRFDYQRTLAALSCSASKRTGASEPLRRNRPTGGAGQGFGTGGDLLPIRDVDRRAS